MYRICFVCMGNICRSPMAEAVMRNLLDDAGLADQIAVSSAGTGEWHVGQPADVRALAVLAGCGIDARAHRARQFEPRWFAENDLVLALDRVNLKALRRVATPDDRDKLRLLRDFDTEANDALDVEDPYYGGAHGFDDALVVIRRSCEGLLDYLRAELADR